jgi:beta-lactam-binding protein with PASTA domain
MATTKRVPKITGMTVSNASSLPEFVSGVFVLSVQPATARPGDSIYSQDPAGGTMLDVGGTVTAIVSTAMPMAPRSSGPAGNVVVPKIVGISVAQARGLPVFKSNERYFVLVASPAKAQDSDVIANQTPAAGTLVARGARIVATVQSREVGAPPIG